MRAAFHTLGCKLNQCESEALSDSFRGQGFFIVPPTCGAEVFVINTCTVTSKAEQKARRMIRKIALENHKALIIVTGCYAQLEPEKISRLAGNILLVPADAKHRILGLAGELAEGVIAGGGLLETARAFFRGEGTARAQSGSRNQQSSGQERFSFNPVSFSTHSRAFLKIQDGCDNRCSYCRVPLARGNSVSLPADETVKRGEALASSGYREIVLTGVNISSWRDGILGLPDLLDRLTSASLLSDFRIRLSSLEPDMIDRRLAETLGNRAICPHYHLPVQSGADPVLRIMRRRYNADGVRRAVEHLRSAAEDPFIAADIITGIPGERESDFVETVNLLAELGFSRLHVFPFSPRPGTPLFDAPGRVPERESRLRAEELRVLSGKLHTAYLRRQEGKMAVAVLEELRGNTWSGLTERYIHLAVDGVPSDPSLRGRLAEVRLRIHPAEQELSSGVADGRAPVPPVTPRGEYIGLL